MSKTIVTAEPGTQQILVTREVDAPRDLVLRAFTEPDLLKQWLGPRKYATTIDHYDVRAGGSYRYLQRDDAGNEFGFRGVFHTGPTASGMVQTFEFEGYPGHVSMDTLTLEERDGRTIVQTNSVFQSVEDRDGMLAAGMTDGMNEGYDRLDELLAGMLARA
ncbi:MAG TPA: SRPBCC family protein [Candidatus Saccharimonadia bacterium]|nr:SRPBCC family protein [Candidatus Saccharimonadia bacterium]